MTPEELNESNEQQPQSEETTPQTENVPELPSSEEPIEVLPPTVDPEWGRNRIDLSKVNDAVEMVKNELRKVIIGQEEMMDLLLASLFVNGHVLVEGVPGIAKTLIAKLLAQSLKIDFSRIQFTPDLMPSDVVGTTVFNMKTSEFTFNSPL